MAPPSAPACGAASDSEVFNGVPLDLGGDLIVALAGRRVERAADIARIVTERLRPGQTVSVTVVRRGTGKRETVRVRLIERPLDPRGLTRLAGSGRGNDNGQVLTVSILHRAFD